MKRILLVLVVSLTLQFTNCDCGNQLVDEEPPTEKASSITFTDSDRDSGQIGGAVVIGRASSEVGISHYVLYWGVGGKKLIQQDPIIEIEKTGKDIDYYIPNNSEPPRSATQVVVYTKNDYGEMKEGMAADIVDVAGGNYKWVIMYYVDADNDLEEYIMKDVNEIEAVNLTGKDIMVIALIDRYVGGYWDGDSDWGDTRAFELGYDNQGFNQTLSSSSVRIAIPGLNITTTSTDAEVNMGDQNTLEKFISFCKTSYPADNYMLLMTNHGGGWRDDPVKRLERTKRIVIDKAICWDETSNNDSLTMKEVRQAIYNGMDIAAGGSKLSLVAFDACLMGNIEVAYELRDVASYLVASSEEIPGSGFPYMNIFTSLTSVDGDITPVLFGTTIVDQYVLAYTLGTNIELPTFKSSEVTLSVTDLSKINTLVSSVNNLGSALTVSYTNIDSRLQADSFADYMVDLYDFTNKTTGFDVQTIAVKNALKDGADPAVIYHKAGADHAASNGLSIFFPPSKSHFLDLKYDVIYAASEIQFAIGAPHWVAFLNNLGNSALSATDAYEVANASGSYGNDFYAYAYYNRSAIPSTELNCGTATNSYIYYNGDVDYFFINYNSNITINLAVPTNQDYDLSLYGMNVDGSLMNNYLEIGISDNEGGGASEEISYQGESGYPTAGGGYFIKIEGYDGAYNNSEPYIISCTKY